MFTVAITLLNGHSVNVKLTTEEDIRNLMDTISKYRVVTTYLESGERIYFFTDKISYITVHKEEAK